MKKTILTSEQVIDLKRKYHAELTNFLSSLNLKNDTQLSFEQHAAFVSALIVFLQDQVTESAFGAARTIAAKKLNKDDMLFLLEEAFVCAADQFEDGANVIMDAFVAEAYDGKQSDPNLN